MSKPVNNKAVAAAAIILLALAAVMTVLLFTEDNSGGVAPAAPQQTVSQTASAETTTQRPEIIPDVETKFLWQYGWQRIASDLLAELASTQEDDSSRVSPLYTQREPETYYEVVTNWKGEAVTGEDGSEVTEIRTKPETTVYVEYVTNGYGESITDENGEPVTEIYSELVTTAPPPVYVTDANGEQLTDENGNPVTQQGTLAPESTTQAVGNGSGEPIWAQGFDDGEKYVRMKIYIDGEYDIHRSSVMTLTLREKSGMVSMPDTLTYNLYKGTCSLSPTKKYNDMAYVTKTGGQTVVTLIIPEEAQPLVSQTTSFKASSTISTFRDGNGDNIDEFTVSVER